MIGLFITIFFLIAHANAHLCSEGHDLVDNSVSGALCGNGQTVVNAVVDFHGNGMTTLKSSKILSGDRSAKRQAVKDHLRLFNDKKHECVVSILEDLKEPHQSFWITNSVHIPKLNLALLNRLVEKCSSSILRIRPVQLIQRGDKTISELFPDGDSLGKRGKSGSLGWNIKAINADQAWASGITGKNVTIATIDGGVNYKHSAMIDNYRGSIRTSDDGRNPSYTFDHDYNWQDFSYNSTYPADSNGHGSNVAGIASANEESGVGVAVESSWITARVFTIAGSSEDVWIFNAAQWVQCPYPVNSPDGKERCDLGADVVSCSWGQDPGVQKWKQFLPLVQSWEKAGMIPVFAAGNWGPDCGSVVAPADMEGVLSVGGSDKKNALAAWSSKGPGPDADGYSTAAPLITAPGMSIYGPSGDSNTQYQGFSGTSQACPHVAGVAALLLQKDPTLDLKGVTDAISAGAAIPTQEPSSGDNNCGGTAWNEIPNNIYGYGILDAMASLEELAAN